MYRKNPENPDFFRIAGEMRAALNSVDWNATSLGPSQKWPESLKSYLSVIWELPTAAVIFWGEEFIQIYNQGYADIMGPLRHPKYLGEKAEHCWPDTYPVLLPWMHLAMEKEASKTFERTHLKLTRHGFEEEGYFTFTFSPLRNDIGEVGGVLQIVVEVTKSVLAERRAETLWALTQHHRGRDVLDEAISVVADNALDIPFSLVYLWNSTSQRLELSGQTGFEESDARAKEMDGLFECATQVCRGGEPKYLEDIGDLMPTPHINVWGDRTRSAFVVPLQRSASGRCRGVIFFGLSTRMHFDAAYRVFLEESVRALVVNLQAARARRIEVELIERERAARREAEFQREDLVRLLTQAPAPMILLRGADMVVELINAHACRIWGREHDAVIGRPVLDAVPEVRGTVYDRMLQEVFETGETQAGREQRFEILAASGEVEVSYLNFVYSPLRSPAGEVDGVLVLAFDVTEQVRARHEVDGLRHAAEAANRTKDEFLAMLGHELRNPLAPIITAVELIELQGGEAFRVERDIIKRQAEHMVTLIDDLLDISRITRGKVELNRTRVDMRDV
ncbi:PAS domain-containing protein, partial [Bradymonas sediminis]